MRAEQIVHFLQSRVAGNLHQRTHEADGGQAVYRDRLAFQWPGVNGVEAYARRGVRAVEEIALQQIGAQGAQGPALAGSLDAFGDGSAAQGAGDLDDGLDELAFGLVVIHALDEVAVDFHEIRIHLRPQRQAGISCAQVVQRHPKAHVAVMQQGALHEVDVLDRVGLGDFHDDARRVQLRLLQEAQGLAVGEVLVRQGQGADVDEQRAGQLEARELVCGTGDRAPAVAAGGRPPRTAGRGSAEGCPAVRESGLRNRKCPGAGDRRWAERRRSANRA